MIPVGSVGGGSQRCGETQGMWHATHDETVLQILEAIDVLEDQTQRAHQGRILEVLRQRRHELGYEERIFGG